MGNYLMPMSGRMSGIVMVYSYRGAWDSNDNRWGTAQAKRQTIDDVRAESQLSITDH